MTLGVAVVLLIMLAGGFSVLLFLSSRRQNKGWLIAGACVFGVLLLTLAVYIALTFLFLDAISNESPHPKAPENAEPTAYTAPSLSLLPTPSAMPDAFELPVSDVPKFYPDILKLRDAEYGDMPTFATQSEVSLYVLHNMLNNRFEMEFYLAKELAPSEGHGHVALSSAFENAQAYFPFSAFRTRDMYTDEGRGGPDTVFARIEQIYTGKEYDLEAQAEALEFVIKNPVPYGGFPDFESERAYALNIHNFIAKKITYSPIGYNLHAALSNDSYEMKQEAFNVLGPDQHDAVCAGYARAFAVICHYAGINAAWVRGNETDNESHAWNIIFPCDGSMPVLVDVTWDDTGSDDTIGQETVGERYFYVPLDEAYEHTPMDYMEAFLLYANEP